MKKRILEGFRRISILAAIAVAALGAVYLLVFFTREHLQTREIFGTIVVYFASVGLAYAAPKAIGWAISAFFAD